MPASSKRAAASAAALVQAPAKRGVKRARVEAAKASERSKPDSPAKAVPDELDEGKANALWRALLGWYQAKKRPLPWRGASPYAVWVSEIMCQQTRVDTVIPYFQKWMQAFPTVKHLAAASPDDVNTIWAGLGYYRRARFLHEGAQLVAEKLDGELPKNKVGLLDIKGIGDYTSSAIASICYKERVPAVDGNVMRVFSRLMAVELESKDKQLQKRATLFAGSVVMHCPEPGDLNQAFMELGATVCTPRKPKCAECPVSEFCRARDIEDGDVDVICEKYPRRQAQKDPIPEKHLFVAIVHGKGGSVLASRRPNDGGLLANQWELICVEKDDAEDLTLGDLKLRLAALGACAKCLTEVHQGLLVHEPYKHIFSHLRHNVTPIVCNFSCGDSKCLSSRHSDDALKWIAAKDLRNAGLTRSMTKALERCGVLSVK